MPSYDSGTALIDAIIRKGNKFIIEFGDIPDQYWDTLQPDVDDRTPRQMLAYQLGRMNLLLEWEHAEEQGHEASMPAEGYAWNRWGESANSGTSLISIGIHCSPTWTTAPRPRCSPTNWDG